MCSLIRVEIQFVRASSPVRNSFLILFFNLDDKFNRNHVDVYDAIPTIVTTFVAIIAKISIFIFLLELVYHTNNSILEYI